MSPPIYQSHIQSPTPISTITTGGERFKHFEARVLKVSAEEAQTLTGLLADALTSVAGGALSCILDDASHPPALVVRILGLGNLDGKALRAVEAVVLEHIGRQSVSLINHLSGMLYGWVGGWLAGWMAGWLGGWMDGWIMDGWMDGWIYQSM